MKDSERATQPGHRKQRKCMSLWFWTSLNKKQNVIPSLHCSGSYYEDLKTQFNSSGKSCCTLQLDLPGGSVVKNPPAKAGGVWDADSIPGLGRSPGIVSGNPLQYSCLENPMDRGAWWATVHGVTESQKEFNWGTEHVHTSQPPQGLVSTVL